MKYSSSFLWAVLCAMFGASLFTSCPMGDVPQAGQGSTCTVTLDTRGGSEMVAQRVITGSQINRPSDPVKPGFTFDNWYDAPTPAEGKAVEWPLTVTRDITLYALWAADDDRCVVTFNTAGGNAFVPQTVDAGSLMNRPADPVKEGFVFDNWYDAPAVTGGAVVAWPLAVTGSMTLYAYWIQAEVPLYTVTFNTQGGSPFVPQTVIAGSWINRPAAPSKTGFSFNEWYDAADAESGGIVSWPFKVNGNITIYAHWKTLFRIEFNYQNGSAITWVTANVGAVLNSPADPVREGYVFAGWFDNLSGGEEVLFPLVVDGENPIPTICAQWISKYTVTYNTQGGGVIAPATVNPGTELTNPAAPERAGYVFKGWFDAATGGNAIEFPITVEANLTVFAHWLVLGKGSVEVEFTDMPEDAEFDFDTTLTTLSWLDGTLEVSVPGGFASYQWYLDGTIPSGWGTATSNRIIKTGADFTPGRHDLSVQVTTADGKVYTKSQRFTVILSGEAL